MTTTEAKLTKFIYIFSLLLIGVSLVGIFFILPIGSGDSYVTLVVAKSFQKGFFYFGNEGPKWGSTSPLQVLLFAPFYRFVQHPILMFKIINLILYFGTGYIIYQISKKILPSFYDFLPLVIWFNPYFSFLTVALYDTILFCFLFSILILLFLNYIESNYKEDKLLFLIFCISGLLSLARPEGIAISLVIIGYLSIKEIILDRAIHLRQFLVGLIIFSLISLPYYILLAFRTHQFIPSSVKARILTAFYRQQEGLFLFNLFKFNSIIEGVILIILLTSLFGIIYFIRKSKKENIFGYCFVILTLLFLLVYIAKDVRYTALIFPLASIFSVYFLNKVLTVFLPSSKRIIVLFAISLFLSPIITYKYINYYRNMPQWTEDVIFEANGAEFLNNICRPEDKVFAYEVQIQYFLNCQTISADGIVGGEILPYLYPPKPGKITEFLLKYKPKYIIISSAFEYRKEYKNSILEKLYLEDKKIKPKESIFINNIQFVKMINNTKEKIQGMNSWDSIYQVAY